MVIVAGASLVLITQNYDISVNNQPLDMISLLKIQWIVAIDGVSNINKDRTKIISNKIKNDTSRNQCSKIRY